MTIMEKEELYEQINDELTYQDIRWKNNLRPDGVPDEEKPVSEWLNYIEYHLEKAKKYNYHLDKNNSLHELRKLASLAIRALMIHGCPKRDLSDGNVIWNSDKNMWANKLTGELISLLNIKPDSNVNSSCSCENCECKKKK